MQVYVVSFLCDASASEEYEDYIWVVMKVFKERFRADSYVSTMGNNSEDIYGVKIEEFEVEE